MKNKPLLSIIIPAFNEEQIIEETINKVSSLLLRLIGEESINDTSFMIFIDDGSHDRTWELIQTSWENNKMIRAIKFSRNYGHQPALMAGYEYSLNHSDINICIDADLQHDIEMIPEFIKKYKEGFDIVYGVKKERSSDSFFKKYSAQGFYKLMGSMGIKIIYNHADFRLLSHKALKALMEHNEVNLFLRGIIPQLGFKASSVLYNVKERNAGNSKYSLKKMLSLAIEGITSFSIMPLRFVTIIGFLVFLISLGMSAYVLFSYFQNNVIAGWTSTIIPIYFLGGIQLMCLGILGEYVGKIYQETKKRPRYLIEKALESSPAE